MPKIEKWDEVNGASAESRMEAFLESATDSYAIMQLRRTDETAQDRFMNQYVKRAHENGDIYAADIQDLQTRLDEIWESCKKILVRLSSIQ